MAEPQFIVIESKSEIAQAQRTLEAAFAKAFPRRQVRNIGYPAGTRENARIWTDSTYWYWSGDSKETAHRRRLNWFGLLVRSGNLHITVEANSPYSGSDGQVSGFFAREIQTGRVYLMHTGRIGGGTPGVGKSKFLTWSVTRHGIRPFLTHDERGNPRRAYIVTPVEGTDVPHAAIRYLDLVSQFKQDARAGVTTTKAFEKQESELKDFYEESSGRRTGTRSAQIDYISRHGDVVNALAEWRAEKGAENGIRIVKNALIDLGVEIDGTLAEVYEVKSSADRQSVYSAIGQLLVHGGGHPCRMTLVIPRSDRLPKDISDALVREKINVMRFRLTKKACVVPG